MISDKPMDRLICGDVGYGKTEVAMRAAFKAAIDGGKQVVVLVPTTVLAMQHFETFSERMSGFPVQVGVISRFRSPKEVRETLEKTAKGEIDILIGTHRLLSQDVKWKDLGLIIIDEEQRFGVRAKEHLKKFKAGVDCLTLSATPIPRTLYMSLVHARDMSIINTPPQDRLPIKSIIAETDPELIQNALLRELSRGGQAFFIHNRVETIYGKANDLQKLVPAARVGVVHGQMDTDDIDILFHRFKQGEIDLLFATTIIENGIDIPNANTILIDRADTYGLADLYQLRGRVGRWNRAAYAYFLIPKTLRLSEPSRKRLNALVESGGYGGGMKIAMRDLEIRGAGDILGVQQSGQVSAIGFHLYCKLLKRAIDALKKQRPISFNETKMEFPFDARLPEDYINEFSLRMELYHRLGAAATFSEIDELLAEMKDRFGPPPPPVLWLYHLSRVRAFAAANHFTLLKFNTVSFQADQQKGKLIDKKTLLLAKKVQTPETLEAHVIEELKKNFVCENEVK
jgi:transcription-repair coupling factor (superfamily II helicase)